MHARAWSCRDVLIAYLAPRATKEERRIREKQNRAPGKLLGAGGGVGRGRERDRHKEIPSAGPGACQAAGGNNTDVVGSDDYSAG